MRIPRRLVLGPGSAFHLWWRGHNRESVLRTERQKATYLEHLVAARRDVARRYPGSVEIHSFCLMSNHAHLAGRIDENAPSIHPISNLFQRAHGRFGRWYNVVNRRSGKVAEDRFKTRLADGDEAIRMVMLYGDSNPVKAGIVKHPREYRWSSYRFYAFGEPVPGVELLTTPRWYVALASTPERRRRKYRQIVDRHLRRTGLLIDGFDRDGLFFGSARFVAVQRDRLRLLLTEWRAARIRPPP